MNAAELYVEEHARRARRAGRRARARRVRLVRELRGRDRAPGARPHRAHLRPARLGALRRRRAGDVARRPRRRPAVGAGRPPRHRRRAQLRRHRLAASPRCARPERVAALGLFEPSMQWQPWWPSMDAIAAESALRAGALPRRARGQAAPHARGARTRAGAAAARAHAHRRGAVHARRSSPSRASSGAARCRRRGASATTDHLPRRARLRADRDRGRRPHRAPHAARRASPTSPGARSRSGAGRA